MTDTVYRLVRSNRRTLSLQVDEGGTLIVRAPLHASVWEIDLFVGKNRDWILKKQAEMRERQVFVLMDGAQFPLGETMLTVRIGGVKAALEKEDQLFLPEQKPLESARKWRQKRASQYLDSRIAYWSQAMGITPSCVRWTHARKRWGSMNTRREMRLNSALLHCPIQLCDYVIVHELAHVVHPDHSPAFHAHVRSFLPNADALRAQLKRYGDVLSIFQ